jgi:hypothetical protein
VEGNEEINIVSVIIGTETHPQRETEAETETYRDIDRHRDRHTGTET